MKIKFLKEEIQIDQLLSVTEKEALVVELIQKAGATFSHLVIDGQICMQDYETYLSSNMDQIRQIEIVTKALPQMLDESILLTRDYLDRAIPEIQVLATELYQSKAKETWEKMVQFIEGLQWLIKVAGYFQDQPMHVHFQAFRQFLTAIQNHLDECEAALSVSDQVLLADLLMYEFLPALETLSHNLKRNGNGEVVDAFN